MSNPYLNEALCCKCNTSLTAGVLYSYSEQSKFVSLLDSTTSIFTYTNHTIPEDDPEYGATASVSACICGFIIEAEI